MTAVTTTNVIQCVSSDVRCRPGTCIEQKLVARMIRKKTVVALKKRMVVRVYRVTV